MKRVIRAAFAETSSYKSTDELYKELLYFISDRFRVNGPYFRGERYPEFHAGSVNESNFGDALRAKYYECNVVDDGLFIKWFTQGPFIDAEAPALVDEIQRCIDYLYDEFCDDNAGPVPYPVVDVEIESRDGRNYGYYVASFN